MQNDKIEIGKAYHIYGKLDGMKQYRPLGNGSLEVNLIHAMIYEITSADMKEKFQKNLDYIRKENGGQWQAREIKNYPVIIEA